MTIRDKVIKLEQQLGFKKYNPEMVDMHGLRFQVMFDTPAVNDEEEMDALLKQAKIENFNFIMIFDSLNNQKNLLVQKIRSLESTEWYPLLIPLFHDKVKEVFVPVFVEIVNDYITLEVLE